MSSGTCLVVWQSPAFEDAYSELRPGVRVPDMEDVIHAVAAAHGQVTKRFLVAAAEPNTQAAAITRFAVRAVDELANAAQDAGLVVVLGGDTATIREHVPADCGVVSFDLTVLAIPAPLKDPYDELLAQVAECTRSYVRMSPQGIGRRTTLRSLLGCWLTDFDERLRAAGKSFEGLLEDLAKRTGWTVDERSVYVRDQLTRGMIVLVPPGKQRGVVLRVGTSDVGVLVGDAVTWLPHRSVIVTTKRVQDQDLLAMMLDAFAADPADQIKAPAAGDVFEKSNAPHLKFVVAAVHGASLRLVQVLQPGVLAPTDFESPITSKKFRPSAESPEHAPQALTFADLDTANGYLAYARYRGRTELCLLFHGPRGWMATGCTDRPGNNCLPVVGAHGPVRFRTAANELVPVYVGTQPRRGVGDVLLVLDEPVDADWWRTFVDAQTAGMLERVELLTPLQIGDAVIARHGPREKRDTLIVVQSDPELVAILVAPQERSHLALQDPAAIGVGSGGGVRLTRISLELDQIQRYIGRCGPDDVCTLEEYVAWSDGRYTFAPGRVLFVKRPGEEHRGARPAVVMSCNVDGTEMTLRPITGSPKRGNDSGHELLEPASVAPGFTPGKVRDVEFTIGPGLVATMAGRLSDNDWAQVSAQQPKMNDLGKKRR